ncbi:MAG: hypothetical protein LBE84_08920 [Planctomycetota bacterium]|jgi:flagellar assembly protein FliH|nr:hypothetical protein [Planctomycetota bacterium]
MADSRVFNDTDDFIPMPSPDRAIQGENAQGLDVVPFQFNDIQALAQKMLRRAQEQAKQKLEAAKKQIESMEKQAFDKGYKEGFAKGEKEGMAKGEKDGMAGAADKIAAAAKGEREAVRQDSRPVADILTQLTGTLNDNRQRLMAQAESDLLRLSLDMARRLLGRELAADPEAIRPLAVECIGLVTDRSGVTVRVNPEDHRVMLDAIPDLKTIFPDIGAVNILPDPSIERGGIAAFTREAEVDMRLVTRLAAFEEAILGFSGKAAEPPWNSVRPETSASDGTSQPAFSPSPVEKAEKPDTSAGGTAAALPVSGIGNSESAQQSGPVSGDPAPPAQDEG